MKVFLISALIAINGLYSNELREIQDFILKRVDLTIDEAEINLDLGYEIDYQLGQLDGYMDVYEFINFLEMKKN